MEIVFQHDDECVVENLLGMLSLEGMEGGERERRPLPSRGVNSGVAMTEVMKRERHKEDNIVSAEEVMESSRWLPPYIPIRVTPMFGFIGRWGKALQDHTSGKEQFLHHI